MPKLVLSVTTCALTDARGRARTLTLVGCPSCKGVMLGVKGMKVAHLQRDEVMQLVEGLRAGRTSPLAKPAARDPGCLIIAQKLKDGGSWMLFLDEGGELEFVCTGLGREEPTLVPIAMAPKHAGELGDLLFTTLMSVAPPTATA